MAAAGKAFEEFFEFCKEVLTGEDPKLLKLIKNRYDECEDSFRQSQSMAALLEETRCKMAAEKPRLFVHLKSLITSLKGKRKRKEILHTRKKKDGRHIPKEDVKDCAVTLEKVQQRSQPCACNSEPVSNPCSPVTPFSASPKKSCAIADGCLQRAEIILIADEAQRVEILARGSERERGSKRQHLKVKKSLSFDQDSISKEDDRDKSKTWRIKYLDFKTDYNDKRLPVCSSTNHGVLKDGALQNAHQVEHTRVRTLHPVKDEPIQTLYMVENSPVQTTNPAGDGTVQTLHLGENGLVQALHPGGDGPVQAPHPLRGYSLPPLHQHAFHNSGRDNVISLCPRRIRIPKLVAIKDCNRADAIILPFSSKQSSPQHRKYIHDGRSVKKVRHQEIENKGDFDIDKKDSENINIKLECTIETQNGYSNNSMSFRPDLPITVGNNFTSAQPKSIKISKSVLIEKCDRADAIILPLSSETHISHTLKNNQLDFSNSRKRNSIKKSNIKEAQHIYEKSDDHKYEEEFQCYCSSVMQDLKSYASSLSGTERVAVGESHVGLDKGQKEMDPKEAAGVCESDKTYISPVGQHGLETASSVDSITAVPSTSLEISNSPGSTTPLRIKLSETEGILASTTFASSALTDLKGDEGDSNGMKGLQSVSLSFPQNSHDEVFGQALISAETPFGTNVPSLTDAHPANEDSASVDSHLAHHVNQNTMSTVAHQRDETNVTSECNSKDLTNHSSEVSRNVAPCEDRKVDSVTLVQSEKLHEIKEVKMRRLPVVSLIKIEDDPEPSKLTFLGSLSLHSKSGPDTLPLKHKKLSDTDQLKNRPTSTSRPDSYHKSSPRPSTSKEDEGDLTPFEVVLSEDEFQAQTKKFSYTPRKPPSDSVEDRRVKKLETFLEKLRDEIEKCQAKELSLDDLDAENSEYIYEDRLKKKFVACWSKLCELTKRTVTTGRPTEKKVSYDGTRYKEINKRLEKFLNKHKIFPDFHDVKTIVKLTNKKYKLNLNHNKLSEIAREAFVDIGKMLQMRRHEDFIASFGNRETDIHVREPDPALFDPLLKQRLEANRKVAKSNLENVIAKYTEMQYSTQADIDSTSDGDEDEEDELSEKAMSKEMAELVENGEDNVAEEDSVIVVEEEEENNVVTIKEEEDNSFEEDNSSEENNSGEEEEDNSVEEEEDNSVEEEEDNSVEEEEEDIAPFVTVKKKRMVDSDEGNKDQESDREPLDNGDDAVTYWPIEVDIASDDAESDFEDASDNEEQKREGDWLHGKTQLDVLSKRKVRADVTKPLEIQRKDFDMSREARSPYSLQLKGTSKIQGMNDHLPSKPKSNTNNPVGRKNVSNKDSNMGTYCSMDKDDDGEDSDVQIIDLDDKYTKKVESTKQVCPLGITPLESEGEKESGSKLKNSIMETSSYKDSDKKRSLEEFTLSSRPISPSNDKFDTSSESSVNPATKKENLMALSSPKESNVKSSQSKSPPKEGFSQAEDISCESIAKDKAVHCSDIDSDSKMADVIILSEPKSKPSSDESEVCESIAKDKSENYSNIDSDSKSVDVIVLSEPKSKPSTGESQVSPNVQIGPRSHQEVLCDNKTDVLSLSANCTDDMESRSNMKKDPQKPTSVKGSKILQDQPSGTDKESSNEKSESEIIVLDDREETCLGETNVQNNLLNKVNSISQTDGCDNAMPIILDVRTELNSASWNRDIQASARHILDTECQNPLNKTCFDNSLQGNKSDGICEGMSLSLDKEVCSEKSTKVPNSASDSNKLAEPASHIDRAEETVHPVCLLKNQWRGVKIDVSYSYQNGPKISKLNEISVKSVDEDSPEFSVLEADGNEEEYPTENRENEMGLEKSSELGIPSYKLIFDKDDAEKPPQIQGPSPMAETLGHMDSEGFCSSPQEAYKTNLNTDGSFKFSQMESQVLQVREKDPNHSTENERGCRQQEGENKSVGNEEKQYTCSNSWDTLNEYTAEVEDGEEEDIHDTVAKLCRSIIMNDSEGPSDLKENDKNCGKEDAAKEAADTPVQNSRESVLEKGSIVEANGTKLTSEPLMLNVEDGESHCMTDVEKSSSNLDGAEDVDDDSEEEDIKQENTESEERREKPGLIQSVTVPSTLDEPESSSPWVPALKETARDEVGKLLEEVRQLGAGKKHLKVMTDENVKQSDAVGKRTRSKTSTSERSANDDDLEITLVEFSKVKRGRPPKSSIHLSRTSNFKPVADQQIPPSTSTSKQYTPQARHSAKHGHSFNSDQGNYNTKWDPPQKPNPSTKSSEKGINWTHINESIAQEIKKIHKVRHYPYSSLRRDWDTFHSRSYPQDLPKSGHLNSTSVNRFEGPRPVVSRGRPPSVQSLRPRVPIPSLHPHNNTFPLLSSSQSRHGNAKVQFPVPFRLTTSQKASDHKSQFQSSQSSHSLPSDSWIHPPAKKKLDGCVMVLDDSDEEDNTSYSSKVLKQTSATGTSFKNSSVLRPRKGRLDAKRKSNQADSSPRHSLPKKSKTNSESAIVLSDSD